MTEDQLKLAAIKVCHLRGQDPHEPLDNVVLGVYQGRAPRWTIVGRELQVLEPLLRGIVFAYEQLPHQGDPL
jgi:hypothetical protein